MNEQNKCPICGGKHAAIDTIRAAAAVLRQYPNADPQRQLEAVVSPLEELIEAVRDHVDVHDQNITNERLEEIADKVCDYAPTLEQVRKETMKRLRAAIANVENAA